MRADIKAFLKTALSLKQEDGPCLEWPFGTGAGGYGIINFGNMPKTAHRVICEIIHGTPPTPKHECAHSCHNKKCIRPSHLRWATRLENKLDQRTSTTDASYKLNQNQVDEIRSSTESQRKIAKKYGISQTQVWRIKHGETWK